MHVQLIKISNILHFKFHLRQNQTIYEIQPKISQKLIVRATNEALLP